MDWRSILVRDDHRAVLVGRKQLVVRPNHVGLPGSVKAAFWCVHVRLGYRVTQIFRTHTDPSESSRIKLNPHRRLLMAFDRDQSDTSNLTQFLSKECVGIITDFG